VGEQEKKGRNPMEVASLMMLLVVVILVVILLLRLSSRKEVNSSETVLLFQQQIDALRGEVSQNLKNTSDTLATSLKNTTDVVLQQLNSVTHQLQNNTGQMGSRLDNAAKVIQDVQNKLGELGQATQEIKELGQSVSKLEEMLKAPKLRGGLGELLLEDLLKQVLPANAYGVQYRFKGGQAVDAIIRLADRMVPVDSKFPLENFQKMLDAKSEQEKKSATRLFRTDVKKHIDAIAGKYILPDEGTYDFALMYIPAENIFYETIIKDESFPDDEGLQSYANSRHVIPVSPNSFYAYLRVIALGLKGLQIERSAKVIFQNLELLGTELRKFNDVFETLGTQLNNAKNNYDKADKQLAGLTEKFKTVQSIPDVQDKKQLDAFSK
jgi:DNA recombination protein RmuC